jgi:uncharacterized membrane protein
MLTATASSHDQLHAVCLSDRYISSPATVSLSLYIIILLPVLFINPAFVRDIHLVLSQLTNIMYCVIYGFGGQVVLTSGMPRLLGITILEFRTFTYH